MDAGKSCRAVSNTPCAGCRIQGKDYCEPWVGILSYMRQRNCYRQTVDARASFEMYDVTLKLRFLNDTS
jgi:hypothetical protein